MNKSAAFCCKKVKYFCSKVVKSVALCQKMYYNGDTIQTVSTYRMAKNKRYTMRENAMKLDLEFVTSNEIETVVEKLLFVLGFQSSLFGTDYLAEAILLKYYNDKISCSEIYKQIAEKNSTSSANVERLIRHAVSNCRNEGGLKDFNIISGCNVVDRKFNTTNSELIATVSKWLRWNR